MPTENLEEVEVEQDEELELQEEEKPEEETEEKPELEQEESSEEGEFYDSEEDLFEELGIGRMTSEQVAAKFKEQEQQLQAVKSVQPQYPPQPIPQYQPPFQTQQKSQEQEGFKFLPKRSLAKERVENMQYAETDDGRTMRSNNVRSAQFLDSVIDPVLDNLEDNQQSLRTAIFQIAQHLQRQSYDGYQGKDMIKFEDLQPMMMENFILDAPQAANQFLAQRNPQLLVQLQQRAQKEGERRGLKKKFRKSSSMKRQKNSQPKGVDWRPYFDREGNPIREKFYSLPNKKQVELAEAHEKHVQQDYEKE